MLDLDIHIPFPSGRPNRDKVERSLRFIQQWPVRATCPLIEQAERWQFHAYLCGSDEQRAGEILSLWLEPEARVLWCGRGGYGATRLLRRLEQACEQEGACFPATRMLGYSDVTALFAFIRARKLPVSCVHSPVLTEITDHPQPDLVLQALQGVPCRLPVENPGAHTCNFGGTIWGGNLAVLASLCGTPWLPTPADGAVFLEDVDEAPYRLDRFVTQLFDSGFFTGCKGVFLGPFTRCGPENAGLEVVKARLEELDLELLGELPVGHESRHLPLFLDWTYTFDQQSSTLYPAQAGL